MSASEYKGEPVQMFFINSNDEFKLNLEIIDKICKSVGDRSFVVYSINGLRRSGKSFLFNYVIRYLNEYNAYFGRTPPEEIFNGLPNGFKSCGGDERVTIGIWIWSEPLIVRQNGEEIAILLVDAQGNFDNSDKRSQSSIFFAISSMISDVFIYNIFHEISDDIHLQFVEMFLDFTKHFQDNKMEKFQTLLMLVRDFKCLSDYALGYLIII
jgi:atlastin